MVPHGATTHDYLPQAPERVGETLSSYMSHPLLLVWPGGSWASSAAATAPPQPPQPSQPDALPPPTVSLNLTSAQARSSVENMVGPTEVRCRVAPSRPQQRQRLPGVAPSSDQTRPSNQPPGPQ